MLKQVGRRLAAVGAIAATACGMASATEPRPANPAIWKVADADTTIYLFGTIHLLPQGTNWRSSAFDRAAAGADTLVVETKIDEKNPAVALSEMLRLATSEGLPPILDRVSPDKRAALQAAITKSGLPMEAYDKLETWAVAFMLLGLQFKELGLETGSGVETALKRQFDESGRQIDQLETNAEQFGYFDRLSEKAQSDFLVGVLDDAASMKTQFGGMLEAWTRGDVKAIAETFNSDLGGDSELRDALLTQRNANWARWVKSRLDKPGTVMVAVGAGHLAGAQSVQAVLENQGVKVTRIQ